MVWNHHPLTTAAIVERTYIDGIAYYDREKDLQRVADIQKEKGGRPDDRGRRRCADATAAHGGNARRRRRRGRAPPSRAVRRQGQRRPARLGDHQRAHRHRARAR